MSVPQMGWRVETICSSLILLLSPISSLMKRLLNSVFPCSVAFCIIASKRRKKFELLILSDRCGHNGISSMPSDFYQRHSLDSQVGFAGPTEILDSSVFFRISLPCLALTRFHRDRYEFAGHCIKKIWLPSQRSIRLTENSRYWAAWMRQTPRRNLPWLGGSPRPPKQAKTIEYWT